VARRRDKADANGKPRDLDGETRPSQVDSRVGDRLRLRRKVLGLTLAELGERCALSAQQVHKYEQGLSSMSAARLVQVADALSVPVGWFFDEGDPDRGLPSELLDILSDPQNMTLMTLLVQISDLDLKKMIIDLTRNVIEYTKKETLEPSRSKTKASRSG
jgi:transcriptional regulator with XRE-family HTH domain